MNRPTLTDVMIGLHKHDLINVLTDEEWTFLTGLILYANERGFKNPIDLAVKQATHAGGGNSRQSVNRRRKALAKIKINGKPILKVTSGVPGQNIVAAYEIDYNLICSYNGVWHDENEDASQKYNGKRTVGGRRADGGRDDPEIRSEEKRERQAEGETPAPAASDDKTESEAKLNLISAIRQAVCDAFPGQFKGKPTDLATRKALDEFRGDAKPILNACQVIREREKALGKASPANALKYVVQTAKGSESAVSYPQAQTYSTDPAIEDLEQYLRQCADFRSKQDQVYPCLVELAEKLKMPVEKVYAEREYLPMGMLETFKGLAEKQ